jgi:hypothetical protein
MLERKSMQTSADICELIELSIDSLRRMQLPTGLFCLERRRGDPQPHGLSHRYSVMVALGLLKARAAGYEQPFDLDAIRRALVERLDAPELKPGDVGLQLWLDVVAGGKDAPALVDRLEKLAPFEECEGMEVAWIVQGLALEHARGGSVEAKRLLEQVLGLLLGRNRASSGLFYHHGSSGPRRLLPNFATEIYSVLALSTVARLGLDGRAEEAARAAADVLLARQLGDGGWPWLYDARDGRVVEPYEVHSVHQHAMAPMGLLALTEACGDKRYAYAAVRGLGWIQGWNELGIDMVDEGDGMIYRSLRRRGPWNRLALYANTAGTLTLRRPLLGNRWAELNATCRPYELGWLLEAWCGREQAIGKHRPISG